MGTRSMKRTFSFLNPFNHSKPVQQQHENKFQSLQTVNDVACLRLLWCFAVHEELFSLFTHSLVRSFIRLARLAWKKIKLRLSLSIGNIRHIYHFPIYVLLQSSWIKIVEDVDKFVYSRNIHIWVESLWVKDRECKGTETSTSLPSSFKNLRHQLMPTSTARAKWRGMSKLKIKRERWYFHFTGFIFQFHLTKFEKWFLKISNLFTF